MKILVIWMLALVFVSGCATTRSPSSQSVKSHAIGDQQKIASIEQTEALKARGFYISKLSNINYLKPRQCSNFELQSHRGSVSFPENSIAAVVHAIDNGFDVVEIDVMLMRSGDWLVHHDKKTGRATGTIDNKRRNISSLRKDDLGYLRHRDPNSGLLNDYVPPSFTSIAKQFSRYANRNQKLNIEIKTKANQRDLEVLEYLAYSIIGEGRYFYSSLDLNTLSRIRDINPNVFVAFIQNPAKQSIQVLANSLKTGAGSDPIYLRYKDDLDEYQKKSRRYSKEKRYDNSLKQFLILQKKFKSNYGLNVDIRHFAGSHKYLMKLSKEYEVPVGTYTINGHQYHENTLLQIAPKYRPESVIIDDSVYGFCSRFELPLYRPVQTDDPFASLIAKLPHDLDLSRLDKLNLYSQGGLYPSVDGTLKPIKALSNASLPAELSPEILPSMEIGGRQKEQEFTLDVDEIVELELRKSTKE